eukprot:CFRG5511T1
MSWSEVDQYIVLDVDAPHGPDLSGNEEIEVTLADFDTASPVIFLNGTVWRGNYSDTVGTDLIFTTPDDGDVDVQLAGVSYKNIRFQPEILQEDRPNDGNTLPDPNISSTGINMTP